MPNNKLRIEWKNDGYDEFSVDMKTLLDLCNNIKTTGGIKWISEDLQKMHDDMPEGESKGELANVIAKISAVAEFVNSIVSGQGGQGTALDRLYNNSYDGLGAQAKYIADVAELKSLMKDNKKSFFESEHDPKAKENVSKKGALPLDLRASWDSFNLRDDYNSYDKNEDLFKRVDDLFNMFSQMQNLMGRIYAFQDNFDTIGRLKDHLSNKDSQLIQLGEIVYKNPELSLMSVSEEISNVQIKKNESRKKMDSYETDYKSALRELEETEKEKKAVEEKKAEYDQKKAEAERRLKEVKKELEESEKAETVFMELKGMKLSDLKAFENARNQKVLSSKDIIDGNYSAHISQQETNLQSYLDEAEKCDQQIREMITKHKDLKSFMEKDYLAKDKAYQVAVDIANLVEAERIANDELLKLKEKKDPAKKDIEARLKRLKNEIKNLRKSGDYIKESEKLIYLKQKAEENTAKANDCRRNIGETFELAKTNEVQQNKSKEDDVAREKNAVIANLESILQKLPSEPAEFVEQMKKEVSVIKESNDIDVVKNAYKSFAENVKKMGETVSGRTDELNRESEKLQNEVIKWDMSASLKAYEKKINSCQKDVDETKKEYDKYRKQYDEYNEKELNLRSVDNKLDQMFEEKKKIKNFEKEKENGEEARSELKGKPFFTQLQRTFISFSQRKDHNKNDHQNTAEYNEMDTKLTALLALDPGNVTAADYRKALTDLRTVALAYIEKKNAQHFHWIPSKLRKFRLQYAKGLADMCTSQLDMVDQKNFTEIDASVDKYLTEVENRGIEIKEFTQEVFLEKLSAQKQEGLKAYKYSMGIDEEADEPFKIPADGLLNGQIENQQALNVSQVEDPMVENVQIAPGVKNKEMLNEQ